MTTPYGTTSVWITTSELGGGPAVGQRSQRRSLPHCVERSERNKEKWTCAGHVLQLLSRLGTAVCPVTIK